MPQSNGTIQEAPIKELVITRDFNAPRDVIFSAFTEAEHLRHWWSPKGFTTQVNKLELRPGGLFHYSQQSPDGNKMWGRFEYKKITPPEEIVFISSFSDENGNVVRAPFSLTWPLEILNKVTLAENGGKTTLTLQGGPVNATEEEQKMFEGMHDAIRQGFSGTFDQLDEYLVYCL
jgi:uncharacterized protein YndB with AHSA1/START domain